MPPDRREMLAALSGAVPALFGLGPAAPAAEESRPRHLGVILYSYGMRSAAERARHFADPLEFLEFCRRRGAGGVQTGIGVRDEAYAARVRGYLEKYGMYLEGSVRLPRDRADVDRFTAEVRSARRCGATILRTVALNGRRYEVFPDAAAFRKFAEQSRRSLQLARPVVERQEVRLALENHKDWLVAELLDLLKGLNSPFVGVNLDTGNNIALLEDPLEVVRALAPYAFTTHLKDMGVEEYAEGFLLAEVPLGKGFLDLPRILQTLRNARPAIHFNLEMITRDPLKIPCLTRKYWATLEKVPGRRLAETLAMVRARASAKPLPRVSGLSRAERLRREDDNVRQSLRYARERLGL